MEENKKRLIIILAHSENAMNLAEFQRQSEIKIEELASLLDVLVGEDIFISDVSYHASDMGEVVYMFSESDKAQSAFHDALGHEL
jgi:hypothetical protein